jgi:hypothetical protein
MDSSVPGSFPMYESRGPASNGVERATKASTTARPLLASCAKPIHAAGWCSTLIQSRPKKWASVPHFASALRSGRT